MDDSLKPARDQEYPVESVLSMSTSRLSVFMEIPIHEFPGSLSSRLQIYLNGIVVSCDNRRADPRNLCNSFNVALIIRVMALEINRRFKCGLDSLVCATAAPSQALKYEPIHPENPRSPWRCPIGPRERQLVDIGHFPLWSRITG